MLKTFSIGGVHPHENKLSAHQPIITAEVPRLGKINRHGCDSGNPLRQLQPHILE